MSWIKKRTGPPTVNVETAEALATIEAENAVIVVGYFKELKASLGSLSFSPVSWKYQISSCLPD